MDKKEDEINLQTENEILKLKMMLQHGATISENPEGEKLPPEIENQFLRHILEFERQFEEQKLINVYDKIGRPTHFRPVSEIADQDIEEAWNQLSEYLEAHNISMGACSPNVTSRELYRFTIEEFFEKEIGDMQIPGMVFGFIYDEFYPDPVYDNTSMVVDHFLTRVFCKEKFEYFYGFRKDMIRFNNHYPITDKELTSLVQKFQSAFDDFEKPEFSDIFCTIEGKMGLIKGRYMVKAIQDKKPRLLSGSWSAELACDDDEYYWYVKNMQIEGI